MNYRTVTCDGISHIILENTDGSFKSFPASNENTDYLEWFSEKDKWTFVETPIVNVIPVPTPEERLVHVEATQAAIIEFLAGIAGVTL